MNERKDPFLDELKAMLLDYQGPERALGPREPARRRVRPFAIALALVLLCALAGSVAAMELTGGSQPRATAHEPYMEATPPVSIHRMIKTADAIFVGQLTGSSKTQIAPGVCPLHLRVERIYRGDIGPTADLGAECFEEFGAQVMVPSGRIGQSYLVFAVYGHERPFEHILFPLGELDQEALFLVVGPDAAVRDSGSYGRQVVRLDTLDQRLAPSEKRVLPPLELWPTSIAPEALDSALETVTLDQAIADADTIFVGRVMAIGPGHSVSSGKPVDDTIVCPVRYRVERMLRGDPADTIDLGDWFSDMAIKERPGVYSHNYPGGMFPAEVGKRYLVFAHRTELGTRHVSMLVPEGAWQNVYELTDDDTAVNDARIKVNLDELAQRLESTPKSP